MSVQEEQSELEAGYDLETESQPIIQTEPESVVMNSMELKSVMESISDDATITNFTAPQSNVNHGHGPDKHDIREVYDVRDEFVEEHFAPHGIAPNDHAALWLMSYKKSEFINADEPIFNSVPDNHSKTWSKIESRKNDAPIPPECHRNLKL